MTQSSFETASAPAAGARVPEPQEGTNWRAAMLGAAVGVAGSAYFGTLITNAFLRFLIGQGRSVQEAYAYLFRFELTTPQLAEFFAGLACALACGWISAAYSRRSPILQGLVAGCLAATFPIIMIANPTSHGVPLWYAALEIGLPVVGSVMGAYAFLRRSRGL